MVLHLLVLHSDNGRVASLGVARQNGRLRIISIKFVACHLGIANLTESTWLVRIRLLLHRNAILTAGVKLSILNLVFLAAIF